jgi:hypothetical protein
MKTNNRVAKWVTKKFLNEGVAGHCSALLAISRIGGSRSEKFDLDVTCQSPV